MFIRPAHKEDLKAILDVLDAAKGIHARIRSGPIGYFAFIPSPEPTYSYIEGGSWLDDSPYHVVHRVASYPHVHGVFRAIMDWCFSQDPNIRIDTHRDNRIMQHCILRYGFTYCGIIYLQSGDERLAYQRKRE